MNVDYKSIVKQFKVNGEFISCTPYGEGHINETFLVVMNEGGKQVKYILQKINGTLFSDADKLMSNIVAVTEFNREKIKERGGNPDRESLTVIRANDNKPYYKDENGGVFRMYIFIVDTVAYQQVQKPEHFYESALAFGNFANLLSEFNAKQLYEILPDFHNTVKRFNDFSDSLRKDVKGRAKDVKNEIEFVLKRKEYCNRIVDLLKSGKMPTKVTHNDTKLNNVLLDKDTGKNVAVIDLDTIMPGSICYDFGDSIRFGCNTGAEDEIDLTKVNFDLNLFETYTKGYSTALADGVTQIEKDNLAFGAILMTFECGMRFLADYLDGDIYFHIKRENHNLDRARTQFKLVSDMEKVFPKMQEIVNRY